MWFSLTTWPKTMSRPLFYTYRLFWFTLIRCSHMAWTGFYLSVSRFQMISSFLPKQPVLYIHNIDLNKYPLLSVLFPTKKSRWDEIYRYVHSNRIWHKVVIKGRLSSVCVSKGKRVNVVGYNEWFSASIILYFNKYLIAKQIFFICILFFK